MMLPFSFALTPSPGNYTQLTFRPEDHLQCTIQSKRYVLVRLRLSQPLASCLWQEIEYNVISSLINSPTEQYTHMSPHHKTLINAQCIQSTSCHMLKIFSHFLNHSRNVVKLGTLILVISSSIVIFFFFFFFFFFFLPNYFNHLWW